MLTEQSMQERLNFVMNLKRRYQRTQISAEIWDICHDLAEAQYEPALNFFVEGLVDSDWDWRQRSLQFIGFH
jgi:hypothetical protein